jgi:hypothetical protein
VEEECAAMTPVRMTARQVKGLTRNIINGMSKSDMHTLHLLIVEANHGRLTPEELRSSRFTQSRNRFVKLCQEWQKGE